MVRKKRVNKIWLLKRVRQHGGLPVIPAHSEVKRQEVKASRLHSETETNLGYMTTRLKQHKARVGEK